MEYLDGRHVVDAIDEINAEEFVPKTFKTDTTKVSKMDSVDATTAKSVKIHTNAPNEDPIFHQNVSRIRNSAQIQLSDLLIFHFQFYVDDEERMDKWIKKLYNYRQKQFAA